MCRLSRSTVRMVRARRPVEDREAAGYYRGEFKQSSSSGGWLEVQAQVRFDPRSSSSVGCLKNCSVGARSSTELFLFLGRRIGGALGCKFGKDGGGDDERHVTMPGVPGAGFAMIEAERGFAF